MRLAGPIAEVRGVSESLREGSAGSRGVSQGNIMIVLNLPNALLWEQLADVVFG